MARTTTTKMDAGRWAAQHPNIAALPAKQRRTATTLLVELVSQSRAATRRWAGVLVDVGHPCLDGLIDQAIQATGGEQQALGIDSAAHPTTTAHVGGCRVVPPTPGCPGCRAVTADRSRARADLLAAGRHPVSAEPLHDDTTLRCVRCVHLVRHVKDGEPSGPYKCAWAPNTPTAEMFDPAGARYTTRRAG